MRELLQQMGEAHLAAKNLLDDPASAILDIDREVAGILRDERFPTEHTGVPLAGSLIPWIDRDLGNGMSLEEWKGGAETNKILGRSPDNAIAVESFCVRIGAMRCHSQALTIKLRRDIALAEIERILAAGNPWVRVVPNTREESIRQLTPAAVYGCRQREDLPTATFATPSPVVNFAQGFDGTPSADADHAGGIAGYSWNWGDGTPNSTGATPTHTFTTASTFNVNLTVTDVDGWSGSVTHPVVVSTGGPFAGLYTIDGFGGVHADQSAPLASTSYWPGWKIARKNPVTQR